MISILLADDHLLFREGLKSIISNWDDAEVIGEASNGMEAIKMAHQLLPDIILMDISMPVLNGVEATQRIARELPSVRVVMLTSSEEDSDLFQAVKGGACGYILKNTAGRKLHDLLRGVMRGESPIAGVMATKIIQEFNRPGEDQVAAPAIAYIEPLTDREIEVLQLVAQGLSNKLIGIELDLSENTIKKYMHNIMDKLHLNNRVEAAMYAVSKGIIKE